jgi:hypothetical protein
MPTECVGCKMYPHSCPGCIIQEQQKENNTSC